ncbi:hypothetical protein [Rhabdothermincola sp.]|uniref:hypothetical protein n=1 Tax=Rhabdothermincola sp. TaxID=2820405 RepID=UPI002FE0C553
MDTTPDERPRPPEDLEAPEVDAVEQQLPPAGERPEEELLATVPSLTVPDEAPEADVIEQSMPAGLGDEDDWPRAGEDEQD